MGRAASPGRHRRQPVGPARAPARQGALFALKRSGHGFAVCMVTAAALHLGAAMVRPEAAEPPAFDVTLVDVTASTGIAFKHENSPTTRKYLIETMGGGVGLLDYDNDGWLDVFFTSGAALADPMPAGASP